MAVSGCAREVPLFLENNARAHIGMLSGTIGSRPIGSPQNLRAREYVVDELRQIGYDVRVQETDARRHEIGRTARVANIIAVLPGERTEAIGLVSHYDSSPDSPGAADDALGVGVSLEAARVIAAAGRRTWSTFVIVTDGEENGLMGAAGLLTDREVMGRLRAYINIDATGSSGTAVLFQAGPANSWILSPWARHAPYPRGGSYALEIYQRLPNDTDFSMLATRDIPGLNFATVGDGYGYHNARDLPERLDSRAIRRTGENTVAIVQALQDVDITGRTARTATFFDMGERSAATYGAVVHWLVAALALALGVIAWVRMAGSAIEQNGAGRWLLSLLWGWVGAAAVCGSMIAATWLLREAREVYHPWYAHPGRLLAFMIAMAATIGWSMMRLGRWLPARAHPARHPALVWSIALPAWILLAAVATWTGPAAAYLWTLPLLAAGLLFSLVPRRLDAAVRIASLGVFAVSAALWILLARDLFMFLVAVMGRLPLVTPVYVYAAVLSAAGVMVIPPCLAALATARPIGRPWAVTAVLLLATAAAAGYAYSAPAYTTAQPLRRHARALQDVGGQTAIWEVASVEPGLDLGPGAPGGWKLVFEPAAETSVPWGRYTFPFVFRTSGPPLGPPPAQITALEIQPLADGLRLTLTLVPQHAGLTASLVLPAGAAPARTSLPGVVRLGRWTATYVAIPSGGITWEASFRGVTEAALRDTRVVVTTSRVPGGGGWQSLPGWLPQDTAVWSASAAWVLAPPPPGAIAPVPALR